MRQTRIGDDGLVVALDRGSNNPDGVVAGIVDVNTVQNVRSTCRSVNNRLQRGTCCHFCVVQHVEIARQHDRLHLCKCNDVADLNSVIKIRLKKN